MDRAPVPRRIGSLLVFATVLAVILAAPLAPADEAVEVGDTVVLKATNDLGVPLHPEPVAGNDFRRVADGARAEVLEIVEDGRWHRIRVSGGGPEGWIVRRYVLRVVEGGGGGGGGGGGNGHGGNGDGAEREADVWASAASCAAALAAGARMTRSLDEPLVLAAWNVRWFPRGCPSQADCPENATDLDWLACTVAWMGLDVVALQEILDTPDARAALGVLARELEEHTGAPWAVDLNRCGAPESQHVGFLWNSARVRLTDAVDEEQLNGGFDGVDPCAAHLRPGRYARLESRRDGGADLHLLSVHLDSGRRDLDFGRRRAAIGELPHLEIGGRPLTEIDGDNDVLVLGDWNTMGKGPPMAVSADEEIVIFDEELAPAFRRLPPAGPGCSEYFRPRGAPQFEAGLLDHAVASLGTEEVAVEARITGYCAVEACRPFAAAPMAYERLSDHCPVVVEVADRDDDGDGGEPQPEPCDCCDRCP